MTISMLEDVVRDGIDDGFKAVVAQLTKNLIDGTMQPQKFSLSLSDALARRDTAIQAANKLIGPKG